MLIFRHLDALDAIKGASHSNVLNALSVCKAWKECARQILYRRVWTFTLKQSESLLHALQNDEFLAESVRYIEIGPIWKGTNLKGSPWFTFKRPPPPNAIHEIESTWRSSLFDSRSFKKYLENMTECAKYCTGLQDVRIAADKFIIQEPNRAPRVDHFLHLSHTHIFLRKLLLDDGAMHATELTELFPLEVHLPHLEDLTLSNFALISPARDSRLFNGLGWVAMEQKELYEPFPRLKSLRLIYCTAETDAFAPLIRPASRTIDSLTIIQAPHSYTISPSGDTSRWYMEISNVDVDPMFAAVSKKLTHYTFGTRYFRGNSKHMPKTSITHLRITAEQFLRGSLDNFPRTLVYLGLRVTSSADMRWVSSRDSPVDIFEELVKLLQVGKDGSFRIPRLRFLSLRFLPKTQGKVKLWVKIWQIKRLCGARSRRVDMSVFNTARRDPWGEPVPPEGRRVTRSVELPNPVLTTPTPTRAGGVIRRLASQNQLTN